LRARRCGAGASLGDCCGCGAGAASRYAIGLVISSGLAIGTLFTLFVVPAMYLLIGATHGHDQPEAGT